MSRPISIDPMILRLEKGRHFTAEAVASELGLSVTGVRKALLRLAGSGQAVRVVEYRPGQTGASAVWQLVKTGKGGAA